MKGDNIYTQQNKEAEDILYENITQGVLDDFALRFNISPKELAIIQRRLARLEKRIEALDETKPEYMEERVSLEKKRFFLKNDVSLEPSKKELTEKETQLRKVDILLNKKTFGYIAPVISPSKEEELRIKKEREATALNTTQNNISDKQLQEALWTREMFVKHLQTTDKTDWYEKPSQNRDLISGYVIRTAEFLSGKSSSHIDMDDIQTARIFLFKGVPKETLKHPAFSYVESFYNYQNNQGHSGNDVKVKNCKKL